MKNALQILPSKQTMSSIEIAKLTGKEHPKVTADIRRILDEAGIDASGFTLTQKYGNNNERIVFNLPYRETQLVISGYSVPHRLVIIDRWQELESKQVLNLPDFTNPVIAARAWADQLEKTQLALESNKVKDTLIIASNEASIKAGEVLVREFCKSNDMIDIGQNMFFDWMKEQNLIMPSREPYQKYVNLGYFRWKPSIEEFGGKIRHQLMITPRGKIFLAAKYMCYLDKDLAA